MAGENDAAGQGMDPSLSMLTVEDADAVREVARQVLAGEGVQAVVHPGHLEADGRSYGLWNLAATCADAPREAWPAIARERLLAAHEAMGRRTQRSAEEVLGAVRFRLASPEALAELGAPQPHWTEWAPGIVRHLVLDLPTTVVTPPESELTAVATLPELLAAADRSTRAVLEEEMEHYHSPEAGFHALVGDSFFVATLALYLRDVVARFDPDAPEGALVVFSAPARNQLAWTVPVPGDTEGTVNGVSNLIRFTGSGFEGSPGPVSPEAFFLAGDEVTRLTWTEAGRVQLRASGAFAELLGRE